MDLQSELSSLRARIEELEAQNAQLSLLVSSCRCHRKEEQMEEKPDDNFAGSDAKAKKNIGMCSVNGKEKTKETVPGCHSKIMRKPSMRFIALKVMYFGQRFYGFASEAHMDPTVESEIFKALQKARLIFGADKKDLQYSRCGRTDKGVSAVGQVIALLLRSTHKEREHAGISTEVVPGELYEGELDYVRILNRVLPKDIRVTGWCPAPMNFSARFSCSSREYKYFFWREHLNILAMETAGRKLVGEHDFRNFCKMDASNVHNYKRHITGFEIYPCNERFNSDQLWAMKIQGSAFLWHQVRCIVAVLFFVGEGLESSNVIDALLDVDKMPRKPQYKMASEIPLVLQSCEFEGLNFICSSDAKQALQLHLERECRMYKLQAAIFHEALLSCSHIENDSGVSSYSPKKKVASHVPLLSRPTEPSYEERRTKFVSASQNKTGVSPDIGSLEHDGI